MFYNKKSKKIISSIIILVVVLAMIGALVLPLLSR
jgi:flagellar basal body-associated protein FliL